MIVFVCAVAVALVLIVPFLMEPGDRAMRERERRDCRDALDQLFDVLAQGLPPLLAERLKCLERGPVVRAEDIEPVSRRVIAEVELPRYRVDLRHARAEMLLEKRLGAPGGRRA